jgi:hypothetical protein
MAQGHKDGSARRSASTTTSNRLGTYLNRVLALVSLPDGTTQTPTKLALSKRLGGWQRGSAAA